MEYFKEGFGLITQHDPETENCNLFYTQYLILKGANGKDLEFFVKNMELKINKANGLYNRRSVEKLPLRSVSKDEILGFLAASSILGTNHGEIIWKHLVSHLGTYNNVGDLSGKVPYNPGNFYAWGQIVGSKLSYLFLPLYIINLIISCNKKASDTSGKILDYVELKVMPKSFINNLLCKYFERKMKKQYGEEYLKALYEVYFNGESRTEFPLFVELTINNN